MKKIAYIDESGNSSLHTDNASVGKYFIVCATFIEENSEVEFNQKIDQIRKDEFSKSELKSSGIGKDLNRRIRVLNKINELDFKTHIICVDKDRVNQNSGLIYKKPFLKYMNGQLYRKMLKTVPNLVIYFDKVGDDNYQKSFVSYIEKYNKIDLFNTSEIYPVDSKDINGVQISDIIAGSLNVFLQTREIELWNKIKEKSICIDLWPPEKILFHTTASSSDEFDKVVEDYCLNQVKIYLELNSDSEDSDIRIRCNVLEYLLFKHLDEDNQIYTYTNEILEYIQETNPDISEYYLRTKIIGKLRDEEVIIASSLKGLKIPSCAADLTNYAEDSFKKILPMLSRLSKARNQIIYTTGGFLDIVSHYEMGLKLLNFLENEKMV